ncbi:PAS domain-containing sensor histidine kinase [Serpentinicella sp. ANB-PHB4]|uniref:PAS domain-containing sensor histidine kinase n=1 Tax=Serpentinicella sp. ANB-PHB4 TaxID=3074076 RepID=UPI002854AA84|nr:PAS domain-containing sensor histidine kinase [Serpentinicella sp. ANB-PHB4]MDR5659657.1 PAS domain-containing sensor histidine kinase [Serpentinicella sp. ANB-PHB4]
MQNKLKILQQEINQLKEENNKLRLNLKERETNLNIISKNEILNDLNMIQLVVDVENGDIVDASREAIDFYGYTREEFKSMSIKNINPFVSQSDINEMKEDIRKNKIKTLYLINRLKSGRLKDVKVVMCPIKINDKQYLYALISDMTDEINYFNELNRSKEKYKALFQNINDALYLFYIYEDEGGDFLKDVAGNFVDVNTEGYTRLGYTYEEMLNMAPKDISRFSPIELLHLADSINKNQVKNFESVHIGKGGTRIPVDVLTHDFHLEGKRASLIVARDITERKRLEADLKLYAEKQEKIFSFLPDAVLIVDIDSKRFKFANDAALNLLDYKTSEELTGLTYYNIVHPDYTNKVEARFEKLKAQNGVAPLNKTRYIKRDGEEVNVEVTAIKIPFDDGEAAVIVAKDMTEKELLLEHLGLDQLRTEFFSNVSNELRTPLNVLLGSLQLHDLYIDSDRENKNHQKYKKTSERMKKNCYRLLRIVNNLIDITCIDSGFYTLNLQQYDIVELIKSIVNSVQDYVKNQGLTLKFESDLEEGIVVCDPEKIERVILNLLSNAVKFTDIGGKIILKVTREKDNILIVVKDSGRGIPKEKLDFIFDRFVQVDKSMTRSHEGSGIGLSLVKALVEMHGGKINVLSGLNEGSEFQLKLPIKIVKAEERYQERITDKHTFNIERMYIEFSDIYNK